MLWCIVLNGRAVSPRTRGATTCTNEALTNKMLWDSTGVKGTEADDIISPIWPTYPSLGRHHARAHIYPHRLRLVRGCSTALWSVFKCQDIGITSMAVWFEKRHDMDDHNKLFIAPLSHWLVRSKALPYNSPSNARIYSYLWCGLAGADGALRSGGSQPNLRSHSAQMYASWTTAPSLGMSLGSNSNLSNFQSNAINIIPEVRFPSSGIRCVPASRSHASPSQMAWKRSANGTSAVHICRLEISSLQACDGNETDSKRRAWPGSLIYRMESTSPRGSTEGWVILVNLDQRSPCRFVFIPSLPRVIENTRAYYSCSLKAHSFRLRG